MEGSSATSCTALLGERFELTARVRAEATAVVDDGSRLTYSELLRRADALAWELNSRGVGPGDLVGVAVRRSAELVIAVTGIIRAGAAYVPLDLHHPADRRSFVLADAKPRLVVTDGSPPDGIPARMTVLSLRETAPERSGRLPIPAAGDPCYVIYTSGSTGRPKGVIVTQRNAARLFTTQPDWGQFGATDVWTLFHSIAFDFSVWELWGALLHGGRLLIPSYEVTRSPVEFHRMVLNGGVTILNQTPTSFRSLLGAHREAGMPDTALRLIFLGAEALDPRTLRPWTDRHGDELPRIFNLYGPTETTVYATYCRVRSADTAGSGVCTIGRPKDDIRIELVDANGATVPRATPGEIVIRGGGCRCRIPESPGTHTRTFPARPRRRGNGCAQVSIGRPRAFVARRQYRVPGPRRRSGEAPRLPDRTRRDRSGTARITRRVRCRGRHAGAGERRRAPGCIRGPA